MGAGASGQMIGQIF